MAKILEIIETGTQYMAVLQPKELFEEGSLREIDRHEYESIVGGDLVDGSGVDWYALAYDKPWWDLEHVKRDASHSRIITYEERQRQAAQGQEEVAVAAGA
jgi:hypothetical protein